MAMGGGKVSALPTLSTAAQKLAVGHDTASNVLVESMLVGPDQPVPSKVSAFP